MTSPVSDEDREHARIEAATAWVHKRWERYEFKDSDELVAMKALDVIEVADSPWMRAMIDALVENAYWGPKPTVLAATLDNVLLGKWPAGTRVLRSDLHAYLRECGIEVIS